MVRKLPQRGNPEAGSLRITVRLRAPGVQGTPLGGVRCEGRERGSTPPTWNARHTRGGVPCALPEEHGWCVQDSYKVTVVGSIPTSGTGISATNGSIFVAQYDVWS